MSIPLDRLYLFIRQLAKKNYGDNVIIYRFWPHGSKNIQNLQPLDESYRWLERSTKPSIYCNDQEPLNYEYYRQNKRQFTGFLTKMYAEYTQIKTANLNYFKSIFQKNILLHSEQSSADLECYVRDNQLIPVYYWSHAVLALDWFRYAQHCEFRKQADKIFLIYNRAWTGTREYRIKFAELLIEHQLIDVSRTWFNPVDLESDLHYHDHVFTNPGFKHHQQIENFLSVTQASSINSADFDQKDYESTKIEVVLETLFDDQRIHLTEKVLRPIACGQPFILAATTGSLEYLKSYGFKTFDSLWDESYDQIADGPQRLGAIVNVMKHIKDLSPQQQTDLFQQAQHIACYNQQHFFGKEFFRQIIDELDQGLQQAFTEIKQLPPNHNYLNSWKTLLQVNEMIEYLQANPDNQLEPSWNDVQQVLVTADKMSKKTIY